MIEKLSRCASLAPTLEDQRIVRMRLDSYTHYAMISGDRLDAELMFAKTDAKQEKKK